MVYQITIFLAKVWYKPSFWYIVYTIPFFHMKTCVLVYLLRPKPRRAITPRLVELRLQCTARSAAGGDLGGLAIRFFCAIFQ